MPHTNLLRSRKAITLLAQLDRRLLLTSVVAFVGIAVVMSCVFMYFDAFEAFYDYSRQHEGWNLDEVVMAVVATMVGWSSALTVLVYTLVSVWKKRLKKNWPLSANWLTGIS